MRCLPFLSVFLQNFTTIKLSFKGDWVFHFKTFFHVTLPQESVTDYTTPSSSLPNTVATNNAKMEDTLVNNVSNQSEVWQIWIGTWLLFSSNDQHSDLTSERVDCPFVLGALRYIITSKNNHSQPFYFSLKVIGFLFRMKAWGA